MTDTLKIRRGLTPTDILNKKYTLIPWKGEWQDAFDQPETKGVWFVWGNSGNGKSSFLMQLVKELCKHGIVVYNALEEGTSYTMREHMERHGMSAAQGKIMFVKENLKELEARLKRHKSPQFVVIDSYQYLGLTYRQYIAFKERHPNKLIIFTSHAKGNNASGDNAIKVMYDADLKIWVEGFVAHSKGRYIGEKGKYIVWKEGAADYWGGKETTTKN